MWVKMDNEELDNYLVLKDWFDNYLKGIEFEKIIEINFDISWTTAFIEECTEELKKFRDELKKYKPYSKEYKGISKGVFRLTKFLNNLNLEIDDLNLKREVLWKNSELKSTLDEISNSNKRYQDYLNNNLDNISIGERLLYERISKAAVQSYNDTRIDNSRKPSIAKWERYRTEFYKLLDSNKEVSWARNKIGEMIEKETGKKPDRTTLNRQLKPRQNAAKV
jgi:hypothetical protein